ncbi:probable LRR receptor-like serine/threonine-protein kinase At1g63430 isoform X2 [Triticum dicoccoides]|uniref:probable LRR receptor-like serine/threonine-protein kinase At1g63430 isoform X2 n=1 Tax=Triticum dicoccoides TaxID=85692 RepID=UPI00188F0A3F|nr:probable LRR receptor-like serine/threonine-protein kinase At1g63430 isoform X2 [Triticum dicoccoides]
MFLPNLCLPLFHRNLSNLGLKGMLSPEIGQLTNMHFLVLHRHLFYGIIPREMGDLRELKVQDLGYNNFNGSIPSELINILSLEFIFLKRNRLYGDLPLELNELISLCESQVRHSRTFSNRMPAARFFILGCGKTDVAFLLQVVMSWDIEEESRREVAQLFAPVSLPMALRKVQIAG